jgi:hypothetical protein
VFDGVRLAPDLSAAVAFLDMAANADWAALSAFEAYTSTRCGARRVRFVRQALELADSAARSPWESRLRVFYITVARLPRPLVNVPIFNREGQLLGIADLFDEEAAQVTEFDGRAHRQRRQHRADNDREEWFEDAGLVVVRADSLDLTRYATRLVERLHSARRRGLSRDRSKDKWTLDEPPSWLEERVDTSLSDAEKAELFTR